MIARRVAIFVAALGALWTPLSAAAEQARTVPRVGFLTPSPQSVREEVFWQELRRMGYVEGKTITVEYRSADGNLDRLPDLAKELVGLKMDIIVAVVTQASVAAKRATATIPIVMVSVGDPVGSGLVASLAHPGGNVTGTSSAAGGVVGKQLELLQELLPGVSRVTALWNPANPVFQQQALNEARSAAAKRHVQLHFVEARSPDDLDRAFATITKERTGALWIMPDPMLASQAGPIADFAVKHRLPAVTGGRNFAEAGVIATYGPDFSEGSRRAAAYVDRILKGARPADLPVEQTAKFELLINARTAKALGITVPQSLIARADEVMQ
jgi:ABC-type uncharacterized transport system substrate-binding protein